MNRKLFGRVCFLLLALSSLPFLAACSEKIAGDPRKTMVEYINAVQKSDFQTMYNLHRHTARQKKFLSKLETGDVNQILADNFKKNLAEFKKVTPSFFQGIRWQEKYFFPPSAKVEIGQPQNLKEKSAKDNVEIGLTVVFEVGVEYPKKEEAPEYNGQKLKTAMYRCSLSKIREEGSLMIYTTDVNWFLEGCSLDASSPKLTTQ